MAKKAAKKAARRRPRPVETAPNDNISTTFDALNLIPDDLRGTELFLDVVCWNIQFFHDRDPDRVKRIVEILRVLNADVLVFEEILEGSLDVVAEKLQQLGAGNYVTHYGTTGGQQRVAMMWDLDWLRAKDDVMELFGRGEIMTPGGKDAFPRLPLLGYFTALSEDISSRAFDFQLCGLHLKSQRGGGADQRRLAADWLSYWLTNDAPKTDSDVIMLGDWNEPPDADAWEPFRQLEKDGQVLFEGINDKSSISHLYYKNKGDLGSRLDLVAVSMTSKEQLVGGGARVVRWKSIDDFLARQPNATELKAFLKEISDGVSDHMPVVTRFYFKKRRR